MIKNRMIGPAVLAVMLVFFLCGCASGNTQEKVSLSQIEGDKVESSDADTALTDTEDKAVPEQKDGSASSDQERESTRYVFRCIDQEGLPVAGVTLQICTDEMCFLAKSDENGIIEYSEEPFEYEIHVYRYDEGYNLVSDPDFTTDSEYGTYDVIFEDSKETK